MVNKCCVPGCQSNYYCNNKSDYVTVFSFTKNTHVLKEWIKKMPRDNLVITKYTKVCINLIEKKISVDMMSFLLLVVDHPLK